MRSPARGFCGLFEGPSDSSAKEQPVLAPVSRLQTCREGLGYFRSILADASRQVRRQVWHFRTLGDAIRQRKVSTNAIRQRKVSTNEQRTYR